MINPEPPATVLLFRARPPARRPVPAAGVDVDRVTAYAELVRVTPQDLAPHYGEVPARAGPMLGYGAIPPERIEPSLKHLAESFRKARNTRKSQPPRGRPD